MFPSEDGETQVKYQVDVDGAVRLVEISSDGVSVDGAPVEVDVVPVGETDRFSVLLEGRSHSVVARRRGPGDWRLQAGGHEYSASVVEEAAARALALSGGGAGSARARALKAPMPGLVVKVEVASGDIVEAGQGLVIVEAMKMENELKAVTAGRVARVAVQAGDAVEKDQVLMEFEQEAGE